MGLTSALSTALTGLQASETTINVVGNNIANSNTVGFKESDVVFATQFLQTLSIGSAPSGSLGGTNPRQIGLGVKVAAISPDFSQGTIEISSNPLDVAIQGDGFLIVQDSQGGELYTRNGQLQLNANNELVTSSGQRVVGFSADDSFQIDTSQRVPITIPLGEERVAQATTEAVLGGVLNPSVDLGATPAVVTSEILSDGSIDAPDLSPLSVGVIAESTPPTVPADASTNFAVGVGAGPAAGTYQYRSVFVDASGNEGAASAAFTVDTSATAGGDTTLSSIPTLSGQFVSQNIYRTTDGGSSFFLVGNTTGTSFVDTVDDATLTTNTALDTNSVDQGSYTYQITFYDPANNVETRPEQIPGTVAISDAGRRVRLDLSDIPLPSDSNFTQARIYRNLSGQSSDFRRLETIAIPADPTSPGWSYIDSADSTTLAGDTTLHPALDLDGPRASPGTLLVDLRTREGSTVTSPFQTGTLTFTGNKGGADLNPQTFEITSTSTVQELIDFVTDALGIHESSNDPANPFPAGNGSVTINANGQLVVTSNLGEQNSLDIGLTAFQLLPTGSTTTTSASISFSETQPANGPGTNTEFLVFDSLGVPISVQVTTVLEARDGNSTTYRWFANSPDNEPGVDGNTTTVVGDGVLIFDQQGNLLPSSPARISVQRNDTASESPLEITLNFDSVRSLAETDALNNPTSSLNVTRQDGFAPGVLTDFIITESGRIQGQFSNGTQRDLGQMLMARFANSAGLTQVGDSLFQTGVNSGDPIFAEPGEDGIGTLTAGAVELSNTDIGQNLIELILASTQYRGGSRVITAAQELLDELLALRR